QRPFTASDMVQESDGVQTRRQKIQAIDAGETPSHGGLPQNQELASGGRVYRAIRRRRGREARHNTGEDEPQRPAQELDTKRKRGHEQTVSTPSAAKNAAAQEPLDGEREGNESVTPSSAEVSGAKWTTEPRAFRCYLETVLGQATRIRSSAGF